MIIGAGLVGCELALHLREKGVEVTLLEGLDKILVNGPLCHANKDMLAALIPFNRIETITATSAKSYDGKSLTYIKEISESYLIGDARKVGNIMYAIWDAFEVANSI